MTVDLRTLPQKALAAAMKGGTEAWGTYASASAHVRYSQPVRPQSRRRCYCGCNRRATHAGMANGVCLTTGCELTIARWVKWGTPSHE